MSTEHFVYKYLFEGSIIYIGLTDSDLSRRIRQHSTEDEFIPYLSGCSIYCAELANKFETNIMEAMLINKYKPIINIQKKYPEPCSIKFEEPQWEPYSNYLLRKKQNETKDYRTRESTKTKIGITQNKRWIKEYECELKRQHKELEKLQEIYDFLMTQDIHNIKIYIPSRIYPSESKALESTTPFPIISFTYQRGVLYHQIFSHCKVVNAHDGFQVVYYFYNDQIEESKDFYEDGRLLQTLSVPEFFVKHYEQIYSECEAKILKIQSKLNQRYLALKNYQERS